MIRWVPTRGSHSRGWGGHRGAVGELVHIVTQQGVFREGITHKVTNNEDLADSGQLTPEKRNQQG